MRRMSPPPLVAVLLKLTDKLGQNSPTAVHGIAWECTEHRTVFMHLECLLFFPFGQLLLLPLMDVVHYVCMCEWMH